MKTAELGVSDEDYIRISDFFTSNENTDHDVVEAAVDAL